MGMGSNREPRYLSPCPCRRRRNTPCALTRKHNGDLLVPLGKRQAGPGAAPARIAAHALRQGVEQLLGVQPMLAPWAHAGHPTSLLQLLPLFIIPIIALAAWDPPPLVRQPSKHKLLCTHQQLARSTGRPPAAVAAQPPAQTLHEGQPRTGHDPSGSHWSRACACTRGSMAHACARASAPAAAGVAHRCGAAGRTTSCGADHGNRTRAVGAGQVLLVLLGVRVQPVQASVRGVAARAAGAAPAAQLRALAACQEEGQASKGMRYVCYT